MKNRFLLVTMCSLLLIGVISCDNDKNSSISPSSYSSDYSSESSISETSESSEEIRSNDSTSISSEEEMEKEGRKGTVKFASALNSEKEYEFPFIFKENMFEESSSNFSKDIALFAFGNALANDNATMLNKFYADFEFDNLLLSPSYDVEPTSTSIAFAIAHTKVQDKDLVAVSIRGFSYKLEWIDNFNVGLEGEHAGFSARADIVYAALKGYLSLNNYAKDDTLLLINGYSRAGAVANLLGKRVNDEEAVAKKENIYTYTFEAPKGGVGDEQYPNIFNIVNSGDLITYFAPTEYSFTRYGLDVNIYSENIDEMLVSFDEKLALPTFKSIDANVKNDSDLPQFLINSLLDYSEESDMPKQVKTREEFVNNYQESLGYALGLFFSLSNETVNKLQADLSAKDMSDMIGLLLEDGIYNFLKPYLEEDGITYVDEVLRSHANNLTRFVTGPGSNILLLAIYDGALSRMIQMHTPEINYVLLTNYQEPKA